MRHNILKSYGYAALRSAAFEEKVNRNREAANWWRLRASLWFRRAQEALDAETN